MPKCLVSWSTGKDSAWMVHVLRQQGDVELAGVLTTVNEKYQRVAMHAVRVELLQAQAEALGLPLWQIPIPSPCPNDVYEAAMSAALAVARDQGIERMVFGDLFLEDVRHYRETRLVATGITPVFPLWGRPTDRLARDMLGAGVRAVLTCVDPAVLAPELAGRAFDEALLAELPADVDPCGERGEFHTFVWDAPGFRAPIDIEVGEVVERDGFVFCDVGLA